MAPPVRQGPRRPEEVRACGLLQHHGRAGAWDDPYTLEGRRPRALQFHRRLQPELPPADDQPCVRVRRAVCWQGQNKVMFKYTLAAPREPDCFLVVAGQSEIGRLHVGQSGWKSDNGLLISFSECGEEQECMLLLPAYGWIRSDIGTFVLQPVLARPWIARLQLALTSPLAG